MNSITIDYRTTDGTTPTSAELLRNPLEFIAEDHLRLRLMCAEMDRLADVPTVNQDALATLAFYLSHEMPLLLSDKDDDLMPRLLARAAAEDEVPKLVRRLKKEHTRIVTLLTEVRAALTQLGDVATLPKALATSLHDLANATRRHLFLENAVLLPLARTRLTTDDLDSMCITMRKRRGLDVRQTKRAFKNESS